MDSVFVAAVVEREDWSSQMKLVGHENSVLCTAYNPRMYKDSQGSFFNICATGSTDSVVSVWKINTSKPLVVIKDLFNRQVLDLSWSRDGLTLYCCSADGSIVALSFTEAELGQAAATQEVNNILSMYEKPVPPVHPIVPVAQPRPVLQKEPSHLEKLMDNKRPAPTAVEMSNKKRIAPTLVESLPGVSPFQASTSATASAPSHPNPFNPPTSNTSAYPTQPSYYPNSIPAQTFNPPHLPSDLLMPMTLPHPQNPNVVGYWLPYVNDPKEESSGGDEDGENDNDTPMEIQETDPSRVKISNIPAALIYKNVKARTLGHGVKRKSIGESRDIGVIEHTTKDVTIAAPTIKSSLFHQFMGAATVGNKELDRVEVRNAGGQVDMDMVEEGNDTEKERRREQNRTEIFMLSKRSDSHTKDSGKVLWVDYVPCRVVNVAVGDGFVGVSMENGTLRVYTFSGRKLLPDITLDAPCSILEAEGSKLFAITCSANMYEYCTRQRKSLIDNTSIAPLLGADEAIKTVQLRSNGVPVLVLSNGTAHAYDYKNLKTWILVSTIKYAKSDAWDKRGRHRHSSSSAQSTQSQHHYQQLQTNPITQIEIILNEMVVDEKLNQEMNLNNEEREEEESVITYSHFETRLHAAILLESPGEFRNSMLGYARRLSEDGFRGKAEEIIKEYMGPIFK